MSTVALTSSSEAEARYQAGEGLQLLLTWLKSKEKTFIYSIWSFPLRF